ncbi:BrnA antitoxin family protein [Reyranella sp.]|uniref:BrnA antitoxin family protein n=1 Tax=Reyranella sp. TaxID=1929291 RepID=UPI00341AAB52
MGWRNVGGSTLSLALKSLPSRKTQTTVRLDADLLDWFRAQVRGCPARINRVPRGSCEQRSRSIWY